MSLCRTCLCSKPTKDATQLNYNKNGMSYSYIEVISFCLGIEIPEDTIVNIKFCLKCYRRINDFYEFKNLALKNNKYWLALSEPVCEALVDNVNVKKEGVSDDSDHEYKEELSSNEWEDKADHNFEGGPDPTYEKDIKTECKQENESEDELLSVIKTVKIQSEDSKENAPIKKRRGRPKQLTTDKVITKTKICDECGKEVKDLKAHLLRHIPIELRRNVKCELCNKVFTTCSLKQKHIKRKHLAIKQKCHLCDKSVGNLNLHLKIVHNPESLPFECMLCRRRFYTQGILDSHLTLHTKDKPFKCDICNSKFRLKLSVEMHIRQVHLKERSHLCQFCSKSFFKRHHLDIHLRSHTKEKPCPCPQCGKHFISTTTLRNHMLTHSTEKNYHCNMCEMTFVARNYLLAHLASHNKVKKYPCQYCEVKFHRSDHRKRHEFTAHLRHSST